MRTTSHFSSAHYGFLSDSLRRLAQNPSKILSGLLSPGDRCVDVGCGPGFFTMEMAKIVGDTGKVYAIDADATMMQMIAKAVDRAGYDNRISMHCDDFLNVGLNDRIDFILAFYVVHDFHPLNGFVEKAYNCLRPTGKILVAEPYFHVTANKFIQETNVFKSSGFRKVKKKKIFFSYAAIFEKIE